PQMPISPPSASVTRACPDFTVTWLPLASRVMLRPFSTSTPTAPFTAMASPSIRPTVSDWACAASKQGERSTASAHAESRAPTRNEDVSCERSCDPDRAWGVFGAEDIEELAVGPQLYYTPMLDPLTFTEERDEQPLVVHYDTRLPQLTRWQRAQIPLIASAGYWLVRSLGPTLRFEVLGWQHDERGYAAGRRMLFEFWHRS